jgi:hypothetical protein
MKEVVAKAEAFADMLAAQAKQTHTVQISSLTAKMQSENLKRLLEYAHRKLNYQTKKEAL